MTRCIGATFKGFFLKGILTPLEKFSTLLKESYPSPPPLKNSNPHIHEMLHTYPHNKQM